MVMSFLRAVWNLRSVSDRPTLIQPMAETTLDGYKTFLTLPDACNFRYGVGQATKYNVKIVDMGSNNGQFPSENDATIVMNILMSIHFTMKMMLLQLTLCKLIICRLLRIIFMLFGSQPIVMILCFLLNQPKAISMFFNM